MKNKKLLTIPVAILALVLIVGIVYWGLSKDNNTDKAVEEPVKETVETEVIDNRTSTTDGKDIKALQKENPDIYAWITIPGTTVDYPILQSVEDNFYLEHKEDKSEGLPGAIYTNSCDGKDFNVPSTVVYGHNMKDGSYFGQLHLFEDQAFFEANREIYVYLPDRKLTFTIIGASTFNDSYLSEAYVMSMTGGVNQFLDDLKAFAPDASTTHISDDYGMGDWQQIITLSTCVKGVDDQRYLVVGQLETVELYE